MPGYKTQPIPYFSRINHIYYLIEAIRTKNYKYICRHFLWLINTYSNQPTTAKAIRTAISELTKDFDIDTRVIGNTLLEMSKNGEIERLKNQHNKVRWNDEVTNHSRWTTYIPNYAGKALRRYSEAEQALADALTKKYVRPVVPHNEEDLKYTLALEENDMLKEQVAALKQDLEKTQLQLNDRISVLEHMMVSILKKEPGAEEQAIRHLKLVPKGE